MEVNGTIFIVVQYDYESSETIAVFPTETKAKDAVLVYGLTSSYRGDLVVEEVAFDPDLDRLITEYWCHRFSCYRIHHANSKIGQAHRKDITLPEGCSWLEPSEAT